MPTGSTPPDVHAHDAPLARFKRLEPVGTDRVEAVLTFLGRCGERVELRLPNDQLATLGSAIDLHLMRSPAPPSFPLEAEQLVDLAAEAVALLSVTFGRERLSESHMDSPSYRLARAADVTPKCLRDRPFDERAVVRAADAASRTVSPGETR